ncbi:MAG: hypothetical protein M9928_22875 [Anaerolineae bacterium]|nr:hypothetical protein [Anaerolineae bacterium]
MAFSALLSTLIANIPFTAAMLPVVGYLTLRSPAHRAMCCFIACQWDRHGGNGPLIGIFANMVTSGIAERAGYPITYAYFFEGVSGSALITVSLATLWLVFHFLLT